MKTLTRVPAVSFRRAGLGAATAALLLVFAASAPTNSAQAQTGAIWIPIRDVAPVIKAKAHNGGPTQIALGAPIEMVAESVALLLLPSMVGIAGQAMFGSGSSSTLAPALSCPVFVGEGTTLGEDSCAWAKATGQWTEQQQTAIQGAIYRVGGQAEFAPGWFLGGAIGVGSQTTQGNGVTGRSQVFDASVALKRTLGHWLFAGAVGFTTKSNQLNLAANAQQSAVNVYGGGLRLHGAYDFAFTDWYVRPRLDLDLLYRHMPGFQETAQGVTVLSVGDFSKTSFVATPMVEIGGRYDIESTGMIMRPYVAVGASFLPDNNSTFDVRFVGPLASLGSVQTSMSGPSVLANVEAGLQLYRSHGLEMRAEYTLTAGDSYLSQGASLRGAWHF